MACKGSGVLALVNSFPFSNASVEEKSRSGDPGGGPPISLRGGPSSPVDSRHPALLF